MGVYLIRRILLFFPTLILVSWVAFALSKWAPGDPVERLLLVDQSGLDFSASGNQYLESRRQYREMAHKMGLDKPAFYFSLTTAAHPDTLYRIMPANHQKTLEALLYQWGNWPLIEQYHQYIQSIEKQIYGLGRRSDALTQFRQHIQALYLSDTAPEIDSHLHQASAAIQQDSFLSAVFSASLQQIHQTIDALRSTPTGWKRWMPAIYWHGLDNQYHRWISGFLSGDFGRSLKNGQPVLDRLRTPIFWTLMLNLLALLVAFGASIPTGVYTARHAGSKRSRWISMGLFGLFSLPTFWLGTMLVVFFTTPEYGLDLFPSIGLGRLPPEAPFWSRFWETSGHFILPVICLSYGSYAFLSRQIHGSMRDVLQADYVRTARVKGLSEHQVTWRHAFRNALFPLITLVAVIFPAAIAGSVIVEVIFAIPGMGRTAYEAIFTRDWPIVFTVLMLAAVLTLVGQLVSDVLYAVADPRVRLEKKHGD